MGTGAVYLWLGFGVLCVSFASIFIRLADAPPLTVAAYRMSIAALVIGILAGATARRRFSAIRRADLPILAFSGLCLAAHFALWIASLSLTSVASSALFVTATPVVVAAASIVLRTDRVGRVTALAVAASMAGGVVIALGDWDAGGRRLEGDALALGGAVAVGGYLLVGRRVRGRIPNLPYIAVVYGVAAAALLALAAASGAPLTGLPPESYLWMALAALVPQAVGHTILNWALGYVPVTNLTLAVRAEPIIATLLAIPILAEIPPWTVVPGGALLLIGVYLAVRSEDGRPRNA